MSQTQDNHIPHSRALHPVEIPIIWMMGFVFIVTVIMMIVSVVGVQFLMPPIEYLRPAPVSYSIVVNHNLSLQETIEAGDSKIDTNIVGLTDANKVLPHKTDPLNKDYDGKEISGNKKPLEFGDSAIPPSKHVLTFEEFLAGNFGGEYITTKAIIGKIKFDDNERQYSLHLSDPFDKSGLTIRGTEHIQVNTGWRFYPKLVDGAVMRVCSRFNLNLRSGDTIVIVGRSIWKQGSRMIDVSGRGAIFLILSKDEAMTRWIPSMTNVRLLHKT